MAPISNGKNRLRPLWVGIFFLLCPFNIPAEERLPIAGVVISVQGTVYQQNEAGQQQQRLKSGSELTKRSLLFIRPDSQVKILTATGQMLRLSEPGQVRYADSLTNRDSRPGFLEALKILFSAKERRKIPSVRDLDQAYLDWVNYLALKDPAQLDLEKLFELMALFEELNYRNRILSLSALLTRLYPDNLIYGCLKKGLLKTIDSQVTWEIILNGKRLTGSEQELTIKHNDTLQIVYHSELESYVYLFLSSFSTKQDPETTPLFPNLEEAVSVSAGDFGLTARANPSSGLILPAPNRAYQIDQNKGNEVIWGWSCHEPILTGTILTTHRNLLEQTLTKQKSLPANLHQITPPTSCHTFLFQHFKHI